jgi:hypothetical protein
MNRNAGLLSCVAIGAHKGSSTTSRCWDCYAPPRLSALPVVGKKWTPKYNDDALRHQAFDRCGGPHCQRKEKSHANS